MTSSTPSRASRTASSTRLARCGSPDTDARGPRAPRSRPAGARPGGRPPPRARRRPPTAPPARPGRHLRLVRADVPRRLGVGKRTARRGRTPGRRRTRWPISRFSRATTWRRLRHRDVRPGQPHVQRDRPAVGLLQHVDVVGLDHAGTRSAAAATRSFGRSRLAVGLDVHRHLGPPDAVAHRLLHRSMVSCDALQPLQPGHPDRRRRRSSHHRPRAPERSAPRVTPGTRRTARSTSAGQARSEPGPSARRCCPRPSRTAAASTITATKIAATESPPCDPADTSTSPISTARRAGEVRCEMARRWRSAPRSAAPPLPQRHGRPAASTTSTPPISTNAYQVGSTPRSARTQPADRLDGDPDRAPDNNSRLGQRRQMLGLAVTVGVLAIGGSLGHTHRIQGQHRRTASSPSERPRRGCRGCRSSGPTTSLASARTRAATQRHQRRPPRG